MALSMVTVGMRLKNARKAVGMTQEAVANLIGFSAEHLGKIERGVKVVDIVMLSKWCDVLNVPIEQILLGTNTASSAEADKRFHEIARNCSQSTVEAMLRICGDIASVEEDARANATIYRVEER